jgi:sugar lactone lactonase YvrE
MKNRHDVELLVDARAELGEGALWDSASRTLYWVDIIGGTLHAYDRRKGTDRTWGIGRMVSTVVTRARGGLMLAVQDGLARFSVPEGRLEMVAAPERDIPSNRFNDGKCDPAGRFWAGTMERNSRPGAGALYRLDTDGSVHRMLTGVSISNGIVWSADARVMYYIDTGTRRVDAFDYDAATGDIKGRHTVITVPESLGFPDGMAIDEQDNLWIAMWGGSQVTCWDPARGTLLGTVAMPASRVTSCAFGGPDLDELYVTTAREGLDEAALSREPDAGGLFRVRPGARGVTSMAYGG